MSEFPDGLYAISPYQDSTSQPKYVVSDGVSKSIKVERLVGSLKKHMWHVKKIGDNWFFYSSASPVLPEHSHEHGLGPAEFGFNNSAVADGACVPVTLGAPTPYVLTHQEDYKYTIEPVNPRSERGLKYYLAVNEDDRVEIKCMAINLTDNPNIPLWEVIDILTEE